MGVPLSQKIWPGAKTGPGGPFLVAKNGLPGPEMCPLLVHPYKKWSGGYKCQVRLAHNENAIKWMPWTTSATKQETWWRRSTSTDAKALHVSPRMHGRAKEKHKVTSNQVCHFFFLPLFH